MNNENESSSPIEGSIKASKKEYESGESKTLTFVIINTSDQDIKVLSWYTPFEGVVNGHETSVESPCLLVRKEGQEVEYDGKLKKRESRPPEEAYITLAAGRSISVEFDVNQAYQVSSPGDYTVTFLGNPDSSESGIEFKHLSGFEGEPDVAEIVLQQSLHGITTAFRVKDDQPKESSDKFESSRLTEGELARRGQSSKASTPTLLQNKATKTGVAFTGAKLPIILSEPSAQAKQETIDAHNDGYNLVVNILGSLGNNPNFVEWFGSFDAGRLNVVTTNFTSIRDRMRDTTFTYDLSGTGCTPGVFAYTYKGTTKVWMCDAFWRAAPTGTDSKAGTVVHELSHAIVRTDDIAYGQSACRQLAINNPDRAVNNADSHEYCAGG